MRSFALAVVLAACGGPAASSSPADVNVGSIATVASADGDRIPKGWDPPAMVPQEITALDRKADDPIEARVLAWRVREDDRPLRVEGAIVWVKVLVRGARPHWLLLDVYRHPREENDWRLSIVADGPQTPVQRFDAKPSRADVTAFLDASGWNEPGAGFRELGGATCANAMRAVSP